MSRAVAPPAGKLGGFALILLAALGGGALVGAAIGPQPPAPTVGHDAHDAPRDYDLDVAVTEIAAGAPVELVLSIAGPDGVPLTADDLVDDGRLHVVVVGGGRAISAHAVPDAAGNWTAALAAPEPGAYRVYAEVAPSGADELVVAADLRIGAETTTGHAGS